MVHMHNTAELGGFYWTAGQIFGQVSIHIILSYYVDTFKVKNGSDWLALVIGLNLVWLFCAIGFLRTIEREYVKNFFWLMTGSHAIVQSFKEAKTESQRGEIFTTDESLWKEIREVANWMLAEYEYFEAGKRTEGAKQRPYITAAQ